MQINNLTLQNFRRVERLSQDFSSGFNVIIGDNGTGKTTLLDALKISLGAFLAGFSGRNFERIAPHDIRLMTRGTDDLPTLERMYPVRVTASGVVAGTDLEWYRQIKQGDATKNSGSSVKLRDVAQQFEKDIQNGHEPVLPVIAYYTAGRVWQRNSDIIKLDLTKNSLQKGTRQAKRPPEPVLSGPTSRLAGYTSCLYAQASEDAVRRWFERLELSALQRKRDNETLEAVRDAVINCLGDWKHFYYDTLLTELMVKDENGSLYPVPLLSLGQRNTLSMVADIAYRCATLNPSLKTEATAKTPGVVLIDEIDLHLYPSRQRKIVDGLTRTFPNVQFITTTHSPLIIQSLEKGKLIDLGPGRDEEPEKYVGKSPEDILEHVMNIPMPQRSEPSWQRYEKAKEYYRLLRDAQKASPAEIAAIKEQLDLLMVRYAENEAYAAYVSFLEEERIVSGIDQR